MKNRIKKLFGFFAVAIAPFYTKADICKVSGDSMICSFEGDWGQGCEQGTLDFCHRSRLDVSDACVCLMCTSYTECGYPECQVYNGKMRCRYFDSPGYGEACIGNGLGILDFCHTSRRNFSDCSCTGCTTFDECSTDINPPANCLSVYDAPNHHVMLYNVCDLDISDGDYYYYSSLGSATCYGKYYGQYQGGYDHCEQCPEGGSSTFGLNKTIQSCFKRDIAGSDSTGTFIIPGICYYS